MRSHLSNSKRLLGGAFLFCVHCFVVTAAYAGSITPPAQAVATAHPLATSAGITILEQGGNAFDAAIAVSAVLAVVEPYSSGIGGGGFWLLHRQSDGKQVMVDGRERAPLSAGHDFYLDQQGEVVPGLSMNGALAAGIPGEPAALVHLAKNYGVLPLAKSLAPAIAIAEQGFAVDVYYERMATFRLAVLERYPSSAKVFLRDSLVPEIGDLIKQPDLATTLRALVTDGHQGFYAGIVAKKLVDGVRAAGGVWTLDDLSSYQIVEREPVAFAYKGLRVISAAPPSSGGIALATILQMLQNDDLSTLNETDRIHLIVEAMRRAYRDRAVYMGDPDFVEIPVERLTHPYYAQGLRRSIRMDKATTAITESKIINEGMDTTHFSILDRQGNRVAATLSINYPFGAGYVVPGTGVLLNDEMDDFSAKPGVPNAYGLVGAQANAIEAGKRPLSSMSPTFVESSEGVAILGTPGGSRIITMVLLGIFDLADGNSPLSWVKKPRFHHQYLPNLIQFEPGAFSKEVQAGLRRKGHELKPLTSSYGNMQALYWRFDKNIVEAASDPRGVGSAKVSSVP